MAYGQVLPNEMRIFATPLSSRWCLFINVPNTTHCSLCLKIRKHAKRLRCVSSFAKHSMEHVHIIKSNFRFKLVQNYTFCIRKHPFELCRLYEMRINVPSVEPGLLFSTDKDTPIWQLWLQEGSVLTSTAPTTAWERNFNLNKQVFTDESLFRCCHTPVH